MKSILSAIASLSIGATAANGQAGAAFTNFLYQIQEGITYSVEVPDEGEELSPLPIDPGGAHFEAWTIKDQPLRSYLLDSTYVSTYTPMAEVVIVSEDPYRIIPRTRADRPFDVVIETNGLITDNVDAPDAAKKVHLMRHVQSYGVDGDGDNLDRNQATLLQELYLTKNKIYHFTFPINSIPGEDRAKVRGEERYSIFTLDDYQAPPSQLTSIFMQVWPVANGSISGITEGESLRFSTPQITLTLQDLYPDSRTYAQVYPGAPKLDTKGTVVPGSSISIYDSVPHDRTLVLNEWDTMIDQDGQWTMEVLTSTPFGIDRLDYMSFNINRSIEVQSSVNTID